MSNYYHRDNEGNWFVKHGNNLFPVEFSESMEIAYVMGKIATLDKIRGEMNELALSLGDSQMGGNSDSTHFRVIKLPGNVNDVLNGRIGGSFN